MAHCCGRGIPKKGRPMRKNLNDIPIRTSGAGYELDRYAWKKAALDGLDKKILHRLKLFGRPVTLAQLTERLSTDSPEAFSEQDVHARLVHLMEKGDVKAAKDGFVLAI